MAPQVGGFRPRRWLVIATALLLCGTLPGCSRSDDRPATPAPQLLKIADIEKYPRGSAQAAFMRYYFFIQWGAARNVIASLDRDIVEATGIPELVAAYSFLRPALSTSKLRLLGTLPTNQGTLVMFEGLPPTGPRQPDSVLLGKVRGSYVVRYDTQLDRGIPGSIRAATAGEPQTKQYALRLEREIQVVLARYHAAAGGAALEAARGGTR